MLGGLAACLVGFLTGMWMVNNILGAHEKPCYVNKKGFFPGLVTATSVLCCASLAAGVWECLNLRRHDKLDEKSEPSSS